MPNKIIYCTESEFFTVIVVDGIKTNLALTTQCTVNTGTNEVNVHYNVHAFSGSVKKLNKVFTVYADALKYHEELVNKYAI